jgi:hypothetical protein
LHSSAVLWNAAPSAVLVDNDFSNVLYYNCEFLLFSFVCMQEMKQA